MAKVKVTILTPEDCEKRSADTDAFTQGWWYHATTSRERGQILAGRVESGFWLTQNPAGASQCGGTAVIRCRVLLNRDKYDRYNTKEGNEGLDQPHRWIEVLEGEVFIAKEEQPAPAASTKGTASAPPPSSHSVRPIREGGA